jgi:hypothetical protein
MKGLTKYWILHWLVRLIAIANLINLLYERFSETYYDTMRRLGVANIVVEWYFWSSLALPFCVGLATWWMRRAQSERRALVVDWLFALAWSLTLWIGSFYVITHRLTL